MTYSTKTTQTDPGNVLTRVTLEEKLDSLRGQLRLLVEHDLGLLGMDGAMACRTIVRYMLDYIDDSQVSSLVNDITALYG